MTANEYRPQKNQRMPDIEFSKPKFPAARYFQVHFEHLESQLNGTHSRLEAIQEQIAELQAHLGKGLSETEK